MGMAMGGAVLASIVLITVGAWQSNVFGDQAETEVRKLMDADLDHITEGVYNLVKAQDEAVQLKVNHDLNVARYVLHRQGSVTLSDEMITWTATEEMSADAGKVAQAMEEISAISEENNTASEEVKISMEQMNAMAERVTVSAHSLAAMAQHLQASVAQSELPDGPDQ